MSEIGEQSSESGKPPRRRVRAKAVVVGVALGFVLLVLVVFLVGWKRAVDRRDREKQAIELQRSETEARLARLAAELAKKRKLGKQDAGQDDGWLCDRHRCNEGDLAPRPRPLPPGYPKTGARPHQDPMAPKQDQERR